MASREPSLSLFVANSDASYQAIRTVAWKCAGQYAAEGKVFFGLEDIPIRVIEVAALPNLAT